MDELGQDQRHGKAGPRLRGVLLVLDATTGRTAQEAGEVFAQATGVTGIVLTSLTDPRRAASLFVQRALRLRVKFVGLGEGADDLAPDPQGFVDAIVGRA